MRLVYFVRRPMLKGLWSSWSLRGLTSTEWWAQNNHHHMTWFISSSWPSRSSSSLWPQRSWPGLPCWEVVWQERFVGVNSQKVNDLMLVSVLLLMLKTSMKVGRSGHIGVQCSSQPLLWTHPWLPWRGFVEEEFWEIMLHFPDLGQDLRSQRESVLPSLQGGCMANNRHVMFIIPHLQVMCSSSSCSKTCAH